MGPKVISESLFPPAGCAKKPTSKNALMIPTIILVERSQLIIELERNQNLILNSHIQQLDEERKKEKKADEGVIKDLQRQLTTLQQALVQYSYTFKRLC